MIELEGTNMNVRVALLAGALIAAIGIGIIAMLSNHGHPRPKALMFRECSGYGDRYLVRYPDNGAVALRGTDLREEIAVDPNHADDVCPKSE